MNKFGIFERMKFWSLFLICFLNLSASAQDSVYVRKMVNKLCSKKFWGRGYTKDGMTKAADLIENELKYFGLIPLNGTRFKQSFAYPVNTFPDKVYLEINNKKLTPGVDFIVNPASKGINVKNISLEQKDSVNYLNEEYRLLLTLEEKLTFSIAKEQADYTQVLIRSTALNQTPHTVSLTLDNALIPEFRAANICAMVKGTQYPDSLIIFSAHYDHLGGLGKKTYFPGANDNASGVAFILSLAKYFSQNPQKYSIGFIFFAGEEANLLGSKYFVENPLVPLSKIKLLFNFDLVGTGEEGATLVNAVVYPQLYSKLQNINKAKRYLKQINERGKAANSDHYPFSEKGVFAFFLYTLGGINAYHQVQDIAKTLPLTAYNRLFKLILDFTFSLTN